MNVAGRNNRYNSIQIDGAVNNDLFGLADTGTPGGQTDSAADLARRDRAAAAPGLAVRRAPGRLHRRRHQRGDPLRQRTTSTARSSAPSATPTSSATVRTNRPISRLRAGAVRRPPRRSDHSRQPVLLRQRRGQHARSNRPASRPTARRRPSSAIAARCCGGRRPPAHSLQLRNGLARRLPVRPPTATSCSCRLDWNAGATTQVTLRHNYVDAGRDVVERRAPPPASASPTRPTPRPTRPTRRWRRSTASSARTRSTKRASATRRSATSARCRRSSRRSRSAAAGRATASSSPDTERFSTANASIRTFSRSPTTSPGCSGNAHLHLRHAQRAVRVQESLPELRPTATTTSRPSPRFEAGRADAVPTSPSPTAPIRAVRPQFKADQFGIYVSDQWRVNSRTHPHLRHPRRQAATSRTPRPSTRSCRTRSASRTAANPSDDPIISPRFGFNWDPTGDGKQQLRGGVGIFTGRTPYVWISNSYGNTGVESTSLTCSRHLRAAAVQSRPATTSRALRRRRHDDQRRPHRSGLRVPARPAHHPRLRPRALLGHPRHDRSSSGRRPRKTSSTPTSTAVRWARARSTAGRRSSESTPRRSTTRSS